VVIGSDLLFFNCSRIPFEACSNTVGTASAGPLRNMYECLTAIADAVPVFDVNTFIPNVPGAGSVVGVVLVTVINADPLSIAATIDQPATNNPTTMVLRNAKFRASRHSCTWFSIFLSMADLLDCRSLVTLAFGPDSPVIGTVTI
jgi:hypothetical protein